MVRERPILFSSEMVRAILDGRKTQTRRLRGLDEANISPNDWRLLNKGTLHCKAHQHDGKFGGSFARDGEFSHFIPCPWGGPGGLIYVRETFWERLSFCEDETGERLSSWTGDVVGYDADGFSPGEIYCAKRPSIHMPKRAARIWLEVVDVTVERLQDISEGDAVAEGIVAETHHWRDPEFPLPSVAYRPKPGSEYRYSCPIQAYQDLWESINGPNSWEANPWVWKIEFKRVANPNG